MSPRRYTHNDPEPHGTRNLIRYHLRDLPDMSNGRKTRRYGRVLIARSIAANCAECAAADRAIARVSRIHTAYRAKH